MKGFKTDIHIERQMDGRTDRQTDGQTDRQTDTTENITYPHTRVVMNKRPVETELFIILFQLAH